MKYICNICKKEFETINGLKTHYVITHKPSNEQKQLFFTSLYESRYCPICGKQLLHNLKGSRLFNKTCSIECGNKLSGLKQKESYIKNPNKREIKRLQRLKYLSNNNNKLHTAWGKRANRKMSFLEQWFVDNILEKNVEFFNSFDIINEFHIQKYCCDFAFLNLKLDVELDGKQHFCNGENRVKHDIERDETIINNGWKVYRITYKEVLNNPNKVIDDFLNFVKNIDTLSSKKFNYQLFIENKQFLEQQKIEKEKIKQSKKIEEYNIRRNILINSVKNCNIDFSKFGWRTKFLQYLKDNNCCFSKHILENFKMYYKEFFNEYKPKIRKSSKFNSEV